MMIIEKLTNKNNAEYLKLLQESKNKSPYRLQYFKYYNNQSFIIKYFTKKLVKLIKVNDKYIGYLWTDVPTTNSTKINDIFIKEEYLHLFNPNLPLILKSKVVIYEVYESSYTSYLVNILQMKRIRVTNLMRCRLDTAKEVDISNFSFRIFQEGKDEVLRAQIQNEIFKEDNRVPLKIEDIKYDIKQEYYVKDGSIFLFKDNKIIGYGQLIYSRNVYFIVNFGIIHSYRRRGYGRVLLLKLMEIAKDKGIEELYIRVNHNNIPGIKLYESLGFKNEGNFSTFLWAKDLL